MKRMISFLFAAVMLCGLVLWTAGAEEADGYVATGGRSSISRHTAEAGSRHTCRF